MKVVAIIQARMGSTRLPGKVLKGLRNHSVLGHVVERVKQAATIERVVVATTTSYLDKEIQEEAERYHVSCYRGSEQDVLSRYYEAAIENEADVVVRVTSDCPLIDPLIIDSIVELLQCERADYASNVIIRSFPRGLDVEAFTMDALLMAHREAVKPEHREHVTPFLYQNPDRFKLVHFVGEHDYSNYRWTLDTPEDWELIQRIYKELYREYSFISTEEVLALMKRQPELSQINAHVEQKKLSQ